MLHSMNAWFLWEVPLFSLEIICLLSFLWLQNSNPSIIGRKHLLLPCVLILLVGTLWNTSVGFGSIMKIHMALIPFLVLSEEYKADMLRKWTVLYAAILLISLVTWLISWTGVIPDYGLIEHPNGSHLYSYINYIFCIRGIYYDIRFNSIFLEPGHTAMIAAYTVFANRFDFSKKEIWIILICTIFTFSLAGYLLIMVGYLLYSVTKSDGLKHTILRIIPFVCVLTAGYYFSISYNGGNNLFNELIISRMEEDDTKGFVGNNRVNDRTDNTFEFFLSSNDVFTGMKGSAFNDSIEDGDIAGAGYKLFMMKRGVIGMFLAFLLYILISKMATDRRYCYAMLCLYIISFWQRAYPYWYVWLLLFIFAGAEYNNNKESEV